MTQNLQERLTITLSRAQLLTLARCLRRDIRRMDRRREIGGFVPAEGKRDANEYRAETKRRTLDMLMEAIGPGYDLEDGGTPRRRQDHTEQS